MSDKLEISVSLSSIQDLPLAETFSGGDRVAVSQMDGSDWQTRGVEMSAIQDGISRTYMLEELCSIYEKLSAAVGVSGTMSVDIENPYVLSSISFQLGRPVSADGYRLSSMISVDSLCSDVQVPVAVMWFGGTSAVISVPRPKDNLVTFRRWGVE